MNWKRKLVLKKILCYLVKYGLHLRNKSSWGWIEVCTKYGNSYKEHRITNFVNNLSFSLYAALSIYYGITTSERESEFKRVCSDQECVAVKYQSLVFNNIQLSYWRIQCIYQFLNTNKIKGELRYLIV